MQRPYTEFSAAAYLVEAQRVLASMDTDALERLAELLHQAYENNRAIFIFGNGGSAATASHFAEDLCHGTVDPARRTDESVRRYRAMSLVDNVPWVLALANDLGYERIFVEQLRSLATAGDVTVAISGSGNSPNVLRAVEWANEHGLVTVGITGFDGGQLKKIRQEGVHVPVDDMALTESIHSALLHWVVDNLYARLNIEIKKSHALV